MDGQREVQPQGFLQALSSVFLNEIYPSPNLFGYLLGFVLLIGQCLYERQNRLWVLASFFRYFHFQCFQPVPIRFTYFNLTLYHLNFLLSSLSKPILFIFQSTQYIFHNVSTIQLITFILLFISNSQFHSLFI